MLIWLRPKVGDGVNFKGVASYAPAPFNPIKVGKEVYV